MTTRNIVAIDIHAHYGVYKRAGFTDLENQFLTADAQCVVDRARAVNIQWTVASPLLGLMPRGEADTCEGNRQAARVVEMIDGLYWWVVVNPRQPDTYQQAERMLKLPKCVGIKLHPEEHVYPITDYGDELFEFASGCHALILAHSGDANSEPCDFVPLANDYPQVSLILAHLGNGGGAQGDPTKQVAAIQASVHRNIYTDTSSARSLTPGLIEWAVQEVGSHQILFGTDTPLYFSASQRARIDEAELNNQEKENLLFRNADRLLELHGTKISPRMG